MQRSLLSRGRTVLVDEHCDGAAVALPRLRERIRKVEGLMISLRILCIEALVVTGFGQQESPRQMGGGHVSQVADFTT
jgi:hypothetical protein